MRLPSSFAFASLALFTGFTFANHASRTHHTDFAGVPSYSDVLARAYEVSRDEIGGQLTSVLAVEFPDTFDATARIEPLEPNAFLVRSWVRAQGVTGTISTIPWTAHVRCDEAQCTVEQAELEREKTL